MDMHSAGASQPAGGVQCPQAGGLGQIYRWKRAV